MAHEHPLHNHRRRRIKRGTRRDIQIHDAGGEFARAVGTPSYLYRPADLIVDLEADGVDLDAFVRRMRARRIGVRIAETDDVLRVARLTVQRQRGAHAKGSGERDARQLLDDLRREEGIDPVERAVVENARLNVVLSAEPAYQGAPDDWPRTPAGGIEDVPEAEGDGPTVAVIDTAYTSGWHVRLDDRFDSPPSSAEVLDASPPDGFIDDCAGHSTFIFGIIARSCPSARFEQHPVLDSEGYTDALRIAQAMVRAKHADVINLSLGGYGPGPDGPYRDEVLHLQRALDHIRHCGKAVIVAAAGNNGTDLLGFWPAHLEWEIDPNKRVLFAVGAASGPTSADRAEYSNAPYVLYAPGETTSTFVEFSESPNPTVAAEFPGRSIQQFERWATWRGTSFSTAEIAGRIACRIQAETDGRAAARALAAEQAVEREQASAA